MRKRYLPTVPVIDMIRDFAASTVMWHRWYGGVEPGAVLQGRRYARRLRDAVAQKVEGHKDNPGRPPLTLHPRTSPRRPAPESAACGRDPP